MTLPVISIFHSCFSSTRIQQKDPFLGGGMQNDLMGDYGARSKDPASRADYVMAKLFDTEVDQNGQNATPLQDSWTTPF